MTAGSYAVFCLFYNVLKITTSWTNFSHIVVLLADKTTHSCPDPLTLGDVLLPVTISFNLFILEVRKINPQKGNNLSKVKKKKDS